MSEQVVELKLALDGALEALQNMKSRVDSLLAALSNIPPSPDLNDAIKEANLIKDSLSNFHAVPAPTPVVDPTPVADTVPGSDS